ncbi:MAG: hypothetical protein KC996_07480 [Phycisphaerales bacterium]|nr:hypothetical protein [Phycisphaerales bacterium]
MTRHITILTALLSTALGAAALPANAGDIQIRFGSSSSRWNTSSCSVSYAGELWIDGCKTSIRVDRDLSSEIVRAFRQAGYRAHCRNGRVVVDFYACDRPKVRWSSSRYAMNMCWSIDSVELSTHRRAPSIGTRRNGHDPVRYRPAPSHRGWPARHHR